MRWQMDDQLAGIHLYPQTNPSETDSYQKQQGKQEKINLSHDFIFTSGTHNFQVFRRAFS